MGTFLDSSILIDVIKNKIDLKSGKYYINPIVYAEVLYGLLYIGKSEKEFQRFLSHKDIDVLTIGTATASEYTNLKLKLNKKGIPIADNDLLVSASCLEHGIPLLTLNMKHFKRINNLKLISL